MRNVERYINSILLDSLIESTVPLWAYGMSLSSCILTTYLQSSSFSLRPLLSHTQHLNLAYVTLLYSHEIGCKVYYCHYVDN